MVLKDNEGGMAELAGVGAFILTSEGAAIFG
jgi:hypothetical protein